MELGFGRSQLEDMIAEFNETDGPSRCNRLAHYYHYRGHINFSEDEYGKAIVDYRRALGIDASHTLSYVHMGLAHLSLGYRGSDVAAKREFDRAIGDGFDPAEIEEMVAGLTEAD